MPTTLRVKALGREFSLFKRPGALDWYSDPDVLPGLGLQVWCSQGYVYALVRYPHLRALCEAIEALEDTNSKASWLPRALAASLRGSWTTTSRRWPRGSLSTGGTTWRT